MLSEVAAQYARDRWEAARPGLGALGEACQRELNRRAGDLRVLLELALGTLPASDVAGVPFPVLEGYASHALFLRENVPFARNAPEEIFLHYIFYPRINSEELVDCRRFFYDLAAPVTKGLPEEEAALAVNRWCAAQMTYAASDDRTLDPVAAYFSGLGRCGEESTFAVTVLRAVGIPARQIYAPWWSHCDDNHAWVEVYAAGDWHFLGACEPEPVLDRGWFSRASSRAMAVVSRTFFDYGVQEPLLGRQGICLLHNQTRRYAATQTMTVTVTDREGAPLAGAWVRLYVLNMARLAQIAALKTDARGQVTWETGIGSCLVEAQAGERFAWKTLESPGDCRLIPETVIPAPGTWTWDFRAPQASGRNDCPLTASQTLARRTMLREAAQARARRVAERQRCKTGDEALDRILEEAAGNREELEKLISEYGQEARALLMTLTPKDWRDVKTPVLAAHLQAARARPGREGENFAPWVQCPRIGLETLSSWRGPLSRLLAEDAGIPREPGALWQWIVARFREGDCRWLPGAWLRPEAALRLGAADETGRRLLFVAMLRTMGIPARLSPVDGQPQFWEAGRFVTVGGEPLGTLTVTLPEPMAYGQSWSLSRWQQGWEPLCLGEGTQFVLPRGTYCLMTANRLPNGDQLARAEVFSLKERREVRPLLRPADPGQMLSCYPVQPPVEAVGVQLQLYLEPGAEPTEHSLNELLENEAQVRGAMSRGLKLVLGASGGNPTLERVQRTFPEAVQCQVDLGSEALETLARALYAEPGAWPLTVLTDGRTAYYGHTGYAVGSIPLALKLANLLLG